MSMKHRVFVAIGLPHDVKQRIAETISQWHWLPIRWIPQENLHITLLPPKYVTDEELPLFIEELKKKELGESFQIRLSRVVLAPSSAPACMIWLEGEAPQEFLKLKQRFESLPERRAQGKSGTRKLHVTIARFPAGELKQLEAKTRVLGEVNFRFTVREVMVLKSNLNSDDATYEPLDVLPLDT